MMVGQGENRFVDRGTGTVDKSSSFRHTKEEGFEEGIKGGREKEKKVRWRGGARG